MDPAQKRTPDIEHLIEEIVGGRRRLHELPAELSAVEAAEVRRRALERLHGISLEKVGDYALDAARASARHCENFIGAAQIPIGIAGPVKLRGEQVKGDEEIFIPLATTEGALVASVNRGCRALRLAGGAVARVEDVGMTRAPVFRTTGAEQTREFLRFVQEHEGEIEELARSTSRHLELVEIRPQAFGTSVYLRFRFRTGDAMGMNMATIACDRVVRELLEPATGVSCIALSGNVCVDKKPSTINFLEGRGKRVHAEVVLEASVLEECLRTNARTLVEVQYRKNLLGSITAGSLGFNAHYANVLAAFFIATGQDVAQVAEAAMGITCIEPRGADGVYASVYLPDLPLGAVGGGTGLDTQKEILALLGVSAVPGGHGEAAMRLAEILGAAILASELSLMSALTSGDLAPAHERLGRAPLAD